jgi:gliding motility-associated-like protein
MTKKEEDCNQQNGSIQNINIISFADSLRYFWNGVISDSLDIYNLSAGEFELVVTDNYNCADTLLIDIIDTNYHDIFIDYSAAILEAEEPITYFETSTDSSISWVWSFGDDSISNMKNPTHQYQYGGDFEVCLTASNQFNCFDSTCIEISINPNYIIVPNIFTPNGDKTNDLFKIKGINDEFGLQIFNRWGKLVFNENPYGNQWNGIHNNGSKLSSGVYYYVVTHHHNQIEKAGKFRLVRSFKD